MGEEGAGVQELRGTTSSLLTVGGVHQDRDLGLVMRTFLRLWTLAVRVNEAISSVAS